MLTIFEKFSDEAEVYDEEFALMDSKVARLDVTIDHFSLFMNLLNRIEHRKSESPDLVVSLSAYRKLGDVIFN